MGSRLEVLVRPHAAERFVERVRPALGLAAAGLELVRLCREHGVLVDRPVWVSEATRVGAEAWLELSDGVVVPLAREGGRWVAITVLVRGGMKDEVRARRRAREGKVRAARAGRRRVSRRGRVEQRRGWSRPVPDVDEWL